MSCRDCLQGTHTGAGQHGIRITSARKRRNSQQSKKGAVQFALVLSFWHSSHVCRDKSTDMLLDNSQPQTVDADISRRRFRSILRIGAPRLLAKFNRQQCQESVSFTWKVLQQFLCAICNCGDRLIVRSGIRYVTARLRALLENA